MATDNKGFVLKKPVLMLSAAVIALGAAPAAADDWTDITTGVTVPVDTAHAANGSPGDIKLDTNGTITISKSGTQTAPVPAVTINSNNSFDQVSGTTISNKATDHGVGVLVDLTTQNLDATNDATSCGSLPIPCHTTEGIVDAGAIDLTGSGTTKRGLWLEGPTTGGPFAFTGNIEMTGSTITITGDNSVGVLEDALATLNGNLTVGNIKIQPSSTTSAGAMVGVELNGVVNGNVSLGELNSDGTTYTTASIALTGSSTSNGVIGMDLTGTINGDVTINRTSTISATGLNVRGILLTGNINACNTSGCTSLGSFVNNGSINVAGSASAPTSNKGNVLAGPAVSIEGNVAGGFYNGGPLSTSDTTNTAGVISTVSNTEALLITPSTQTAPIVLGVYTSDTTNPGFSFYNRGTIGSTSSNAGDNNVGVNIFGGNTNSTVTLTGGLFNSGSITSIAASATGTTAVVSSGLVIGNYANVGTADTYTIGCAQNSNACTYTYNNAGSGKTDMASFVNSSSTGKGIISSTVSGPVANGLAQALVIASSAKMPSLINSGTISATATTSVLTNKGLSAFAIIDESGTLTYLQNNGTISAVATTLNDGSQRAVAIDLSNDNVNTPSATGVAIVNHATASTKATILGDILFGTGDMQIVDVAGLSSDNTATITGNISYGGGTSTGGFGTDKLTISDFSTVTGTVTAQNGVDVDVQNGGTLTLQNKDVALLANAFHIENGGTLNVTVLNSFASGIITAQNSANGPDGIVALDTGAKLNITYGSFVPSDSQFVLITAPQGQLTVSDLATYNQQLAASIPFLFQSSTLSIAQTTTSIGPTDELVLTVDPKTAAQLGLTGYAAQMLPYANQALVNDDVLGAAMVAGITNQQTAQRAYNQFAPNVSGGVRAIAISLTDQSSGPVASRQRTLRMYGKQEGEITLWGQEFAEYMTDPGRVSTGQTGFKDHGFGFVLGLDGGEPKTGWYGGAFSFYSGDVVEPSPRDSHSNTLWYMLTGYTDWRGRGLFLDTKLDVGYMDIKEKRFLNLTIPNASGGTTAFIDEADSKRPGLVGSGGFTTGAIFAYGSTILTPQFSMDGMTMREEGYTETHVGKNNGNGMGFNLHAQSYYASSLRAFLGTEIREDLNLGDFFVQPDLRLGYRYDFLNDPAKLKVNFADLGANVTPPVFTVIGPDPSQGNFVAGASLSATTDAWTIGANFDFVRGTNGATTEVGIIHLLGRI
jgi:hypothetical protein